MFVYCGNCAPCYSDHSGQYIEDHTIKGYRTEDGVLHGFNVHVDERFLSPNYCLGFAEELIEQKGESGEYLGMSAERIALEIYAHALLYYYALSIRDPYDSSDAVSFLVQPKSDGERFGEAVVSWSRNKLLETCEIITVNNDERWIEKQLFIVIWNCKTGRSYREE